MLRETDLVMKRIPTNNTQLNSKTAHPQPPPREIPGHLTQAPYSGEFDLSKRLSAVGDKRISQLFDSAREPRSRVIALVDSTWVFLLLSFHL